MSAIQINPNKDIDTARQALFAGDLLIYSQLPSVQALCRFADELIRETFGDLEPEKAQFELPVEQFVEKIGPLKSHFTNHLRVKEMVRNIIGDFSCDLDTTYFDVPRLRVVTADKYLQAGVGYAYKAHRDTWYSSPFAQLNWWVPVYALTPERTMTMYPQYWDQPIANSSQDFDYEEWCQVGRPQAQNQIKVDTRKHPLPLEEVESTGELRVALSSGDLFLFSAVHLHATTPNTSGATRFSFDFRTVQLEDLDSPALPANCDTAARGTTLGDMLRASDFAPIEIGQPA